MDDIYITSIKARTIKEAEEKLIDRMVDTYDIDYPGGLSELKDLLNAEGVSFGELYDLEEF